MKAKVFVLLPLLFVFCVSTWGQNYSEDLQQVRRALNEGNCKKASELYDNYKVHAKQGDIELEGAINYCYGEDCFNEKRYTQAKEWYLISATQGNSDAEFMLGWMYRKGLGVEQNNNEAIKWYKLAAEHGSVAAQYNLGWIYEHVYDYRDYAAALKWYELAAEQGNPYAQTNLGSMYYEGKGVKQDCEKSLKWFRCGADEGISEAYHYLGDMYFKGECIKRDYDKAIKWYNQAVAQKYIPAYNSMGYVYYKGLGDYLEALKWFQLALDQGDIHAPYNLGEMYEYGLGVEKDIGKAKHYYQLADKRGNVAPFVLKPWAFEQEEQIVFEKPRIQWLSTFATTNQSQYILNATIISDSKIEHYKVFLNDVEIRENNDPDGSAITEDPKEQDNYNIAISRTLVLREDLNTIKIEAKNAGGITIDERKIVYMPTKQEPVAVAKALIVWGDLPTTTTNPRLELDAVVRSTVSDVSCRVLLNKEEVLLLAKGSSIVENPNEPEYKYNIKVQRILNLKDDDNTIVIEVLNGKGVLLTSGKKKISYTKPALATIVWGDVPTTTEEKQITLKAQIKSDSPIEYYCILKDEKALKKVIINVATKGSSIVEDSKKGKNDSNNVSMNELVELAEGNNNFVIEVKNVGGVVRTQPMTVHYNHKEKRIALVIGNEAYNDERMRLRCPSNDAKAVATRYRQLGFDEVILKNNLPKTEMQALINNFRSKSMDYDAVIVYYSGHGVQVNQINYIIPTDFDFSNGSVTNDCVAVTYLLRDLGEDRMKIVVYDACRTQPRPKGDITDVDVMNNVNTFIAYASSVGQPSYEDPDSPYSIYTAAYLEVLDVPNLELDDVFMRVNRIVRQKTSSMNVKQVPYREGSMDKDFIFNKKESR